MSNTHQLIQLDTGEYFIVSKTELQILQLIADTPGITSSIITTIIKLHINSTCVILCKLKQNGMVSGEFSNEQPLLRYAPIHTFKCVDVQAYRGMRFVEGSDTIVKNADGYFYMPGNTYLLFKYCVNHRTKMKNGYVGKHCGVCQGNVSTIFAWLKKMRLLTLRDDVFWENDPFTIIPLNFLNKRTK